MNDIVADVLFASPVVALVLLAYGLYANFRVRRALRQTNAAKEARRVAEAQASSALSAKVTAEVARDIAVQEMTRTNEERRIATEQADELRTEVDRLVTLDERIRHDVPKRLLAVCKLIEATLPDQELRTHAIEDLQTAIEKIRLHLAPSIKDYVASQRNAGKGLDADGMPVVKLVRWIARMIDCEKDVIVEGDPKIGMANKRVFWDLLLSNVMSNAAQHVSDDGKIRVTVTLQEDGLGQVEIYNDGQAIPKAEIKQVFAMGRSTKEGGRGLGLFVAKEVAEGMGARMLDPVNVRTGFGLFHGGVKFTITDLPVVQLP
jgi:signal transduction histidine kinase